MRGHRILQRNYPKCFLRKEERASLASKRTPSAAYYTPPFLHIITAELCAKRKLIFTTFDFVVQISISPGIMLFKNLK